MKTKTKKTAKRASASLHPDCYAAAVKALLAQANSNEKTFVRKDKFPSTEDSLMKEASTLRYAALWLKKNKRHNKKVSDAPDSAAPNRK